MTISRRDTILIAVLINIGLLSILFMTAMPVEEEPIVVAHDFKHAATSEAHVEKTLVPAPIPITLSSPEGPSDEVDNAIKEYQARLQSQEEKPASTLPQLTNESQEKYLEITVKRGDALEKIARANGTTVKEIKKINHLISDALAIGQKLRVPAPQGESLQETQAQPEDDGVHYVIKSGDNPWKIARKFHVKYEDILLWNALDEDKARNLKVGDTIRVK